MRDDYSFRPHLARNGEGAAPVRVSRKPLFGPAALTASRGGDGEGGGGKGRGLWVGACIGEGGGGQGCGLGSESVGRVGEDRGEGCGGLGGGGLGANASGVDADGGRACVWRR